MSSAPAVLAGTARWSVEVGDCLDVLATLADASIDAVVTDPPYGIGFMGREWDTFQPERVARLTARKKRKTTEPPPGHGHHESNGYVEYDRSLSGNQRFQAWCERWAAECLRVLKPGGHLVSFGGTRTYHRLACAIEDAGFEVRDSLHWIFGTGFPKSRNLDGDWEGWGSALKPAHEPIVLARKPLVGSIEANVLAYGTGALNIAASRLDAVGNITFTRHAGDRPRDQWRTGGAVEGTRRESGTGRWPPNVLLGEDAAAELDRQSGELTSGANPTRRGSDKFRGVYADFKGQEECTPARGVDSGGASRFFPIFKYEAKADRAEREAGLDHLPLGRGGMVSNTSGQHITRRDGGAPGPVRNHHPTVKPVALMAWLCRLVTPPGGVVLDPFTGSGTTGIAARRCGFRFVGIEREAEYAAIARARIDGDMGPMFRGLSDEGAAG